MGIFSFSHVSNIFFVWALIIADLTTFEITGPDVLNGAFIRIVFLAVLP